MYQSNESSLTHLLDEPADNKSQTKILLLGTPSVNIGNEFLDRGSVFAIKAAAPFCQVSKFSGSARFYFETAHDSWIKRLWRKSWHERNKIIESIIGSKNLKRIQRKVYYRNLVIYDQSNYFDLSSFYSPKYVAISGCILNPYTISRYGQSLLNFRKKGVEVIMHGAGGENYSGSEVALAKNFLKKLNPLVFVSRDEPSYKFYGNFAKYSYSGIDCGFFISDYFKEAKLESIPLENYVVLNFDRVEEPKLDGDQLLVRVHHSPLGLAESFPQLPKKYYNKPNTFVSDVADEYLCIYSNANMIHTDRVHSCVVSLSFGKPFRLYLGTERTALLSRVGVDNPMIVNYPNTNKIQKEKQNQISFLSEVIKQR